MRVFFIIAFAAILVLAIFRLAFLGKKEELATIKTPSQKAIAPASQVLDYDQADSLYAGYQRVRDGNQMGLLNEEGKIALAFNYEALGYPKNGILKAKKDGKWGLINLKMEMIDSFVYDDLRHWKGGLWWGKRKKYWGIIDTKELMDSKGSLSEVFIAALRQGIHFRNDSVHLLGAEVAVVYNYGTAQVYKPGTSIKVYKNISPQITGGYLIATDMADKQGLIDLDGWEKLAPAYDQILPFSDGLARVRLGRKWGYIDLRGEEVIAPQYDKAADFSDGLAAVQLGKKRGYITPEGNWQIENPLTDEPFHNGLARAKSKNLWGYIDKNNGLRIPYIYQSATHFGDKLAWVQTPEQAEKEEFTCIDVNGVIHHIATDIAKPQPFSYGFSLVKERNTPYYFYISDAFTRLKGEYIAAEPFNAAGKAKVSSYAGSFCINNKGKLVEMLD